MYDYEIFYFQCGYLVSELHDLDPEYNIYFEKNK